VAEKRGVVKVFDSLSDPAPDVFAARLRGMAPAAALEELQTIHGIGPFSAELILLRGAGEPDHLARNEPRLRRAIALAYGLGGEPSEDELVEISDRWRPYRTWVTLLLRAYLEDETHEIRRGRPAAR